MVYYIIPTLSYMEPFEGANERLLEHTLDSIAKKFHRRVIVSTDQGWALDYVEDMRVKGMPVSENIKENEGSYKDVLVEVGNRMTMEGDDEFVMLSLEYPNRTYRNIRSAIQHYRKNPYAKSMLCRMPSKEVPQKIMIENEEGQGGTPLVENEGQEWKESEFEQGFRHSHFITISQVSEISELNTWLWNEDTIFFPINSNNIRRVRTKKQLDAIEND